MSRRPSVPTPSTIRRSYDLRTEALRELIALAQRLNCTVTEALNRLLEDVAPTVTPQE